VIPVLLILLAAYWLAAPDPATAGARTAAGTGVRAAGSGARQHWASGRDGRQLRRTDRRDRWSKSGGFWRNLLRLEHGAVIGGKAVKGAAGITAAAARPVPAAVKRGWVQGMERHRERAGDRPAGLVLDPPWWHRGQPQVQPADPQVQDPGTGREQVQVQAGEQPRNSPEVQDGGQDELDTEEQIRGRRTPDWNRMFPAPLTEADRRFWTARDGGYSGPLDQDGRPGDPEQWPFKADPSPTDTTTDLPAGTSPAGTPSTTAIPTEGDPVSVNVPSEINDLTTLHGFAQAVIEDAEENGPGSTYAQAAASISEYFGRDFGREVNATASSFEEAAAAFNQAWQQMVEAADAMKTESLAAIGG
jgi:hypothetical protein